MLVSDYAKPAVRLNRRKYSCNERFFAKLTAVSAYWLGFVIADGWVTIRKRQGTQQFVFGTASKDREHLVKLLTALQANHKVHGPYNGTYNFLITSWPLCNDLEQYGVIPRKSLVATFPIVPAALRPHLMRGLVDGDGSFNRYRRPRKTCSDVFYLTLSLVGSHAICDAFKAEFGKGSISRKANVYQYSCIGDTAHRALRWMYDRPGPVLSRKKQLLQELGVL